MTLRALARQMAPKAVVPRRLIGLDLGQANDYTAIIVASPSAAPEPHYAIPYIQRLRELRYPDVVKRVVQVVESLRRPIDTGSGTVRPDVTLIVDYTGVGRPVLDMLLEAEPDCDLIPVTITGGAQINQTEFGLTVPKRELASVIQRLLQEKRITINQKAPMAKDLTDELKGFRAKISASGHISYAAAEDWRSAQHDDLVLGTALALWYGEWTKEN